MVDRLNCEGWEENEEDEHKEAVYFVNYCPENDIL